MDKKLDKMYLVVDDSGMMRRIVKNCLLSYGVSDANIVEAGDGLEAMTVLAMTKVDCVIADWNMPNCDGLEFLKKMRALVGHDHTPFIMVTTESSRESVLEAIRGGISAYLVKPIKPELLKRRLDEVLPQSV